MSRKVVGGHRWVPTLLGPSSADDREEDVLEGRLLLDVLDLRRREQLLELGEGAVGDDSSLVEDRDPVGELFGLVEVLRGEQHRGAVAGELPDRLPDLDPRLWIESGRRLVEEEHGRVADQAHRDVEATAHPARVGRHPAAGRVGQVEPGQQVVRDRAGVVEVPQLGDQDEVLPSGEDLVDGGELAGEADRLAHLRGLGGDVVPVDGRSSAVGLEQRGQDLHHRGLAGTVGAEQGEDGARRNAQIDAPEHRVVAEGLGEPGDLDGWCRGHGASLQP